MPVTPRRTHEQRDQVDRILSALQISDLNHRDPVLHIAVANHDIRILDLGFLGADEEIALPAFIEVLEPLQDRVIEFLNRMVIVYVDRTRN